MIPHIKKENNSCKSEGKNEEGNYDNHFPTRNVLKEDCKGYCDCPQHDNVVGL